MDGMRRRLGWMRRRRDNGDAAASSTRRESAKLPRESSARRSAFVGHVSGTVQSATMPLKRMMERVKNRFAASTARRHHHTPRGPSVATTSSTAPIEVLKFCVWRGGRGWSLQRRYLLDEARYVWMVGFVADVSAWEDDGLRPGDILETIGGGSVACVASESEVEARLEAASVGTVLRFRVRAAVDRCRVQRLVLAVYGGKSIGVSVVADGIDAVPVVIHVPTTEESGKMVCARLGDVLVEVNGKSVVGLGMHAVTALVAASRPHVKLTFLRWMHTDCGPRCRDGARMVVRPSVLSMWRMRMTGDEFHDFGDEEPDSDASVTIVLVWRSGPLGITLMKDDDAQMPIVNRLTGKGTVLGVDKLRHGYHLASINGTPTHRRRFRDVLRDLERAKKPLWLVFLAPLHRVSMYSTCSRETGIHNRPSQYSCGSRWSSSSSLLSLDDSWDVRSTRRYTSTVPTTYESTDE